MSNILGDNKQQVLALGRLGWSHLPCGKDHEHLHCLAAVDERSGRLRCAESASAHGADLPEQAVLVPVDPMLNDFPVEHPVDVTFRPRHALVRWFLPHQ